MGLRVRGGGCGARWRFPAISAARPPLAAKTVWEKGRIAALSCSLHREPDAQQQLSLQQIGIMCELCNGSGWLICDFCRGQKTNVKSKSSRFYRRCPDCKAVGLVLCPKCKVFKCVSFPDFSDSQA